MAESEVVLRPHAPAAAEAKASAPKIVSVWRQLFHLLVASVMALAAYILISHFVLQSVQVVGVSMQPTLHNADRCFLKRWIYYVRAPQRGDIVVIKDPTDGTYAVKRIIAVAGDSLYLKDGSVYVNGRKLHEGYLMPGTWTSTCSSLSEELISCGTERYFVMGDNRDNSFDSRFYGTIPRQNILGVVTP